MSFGADEDILQDFIVEAGEILELLSEQLVELENSPDDSDLLNAIFRGFHTVKGGAGFLQLEPLVEVCHSAENLFDLLRNDKLEVNADLMDVVLQSLDAVQSLFEQVKARDELDPADPALLDALNAWVDRGNQGKGDSVASASEESAPPIIEEAPQEEISASAEAGEPGPNDDITEEEFEALLDQLHGSGAPGGDKPAATEAPATNQPDPSGNITEAEFDALLDELHGKGQGPTKAKAGAVPAEAAAPPKKAAPKKPAKDAAPAETTVRVDTKRLDDIMNMVGELVLVRNRLVRLGLKSTDEAMAKTVANLDVVTGDLQTAVMKTRMQPVKKVFGRFPRVVRDLARNLKKEIRLRLEGEDTDLDKNLVEALADPLVHLVRNSVDHGIEAPDVREAQGKSRSGTVVLAAEQEGDHIVLSITDDGGGMDADVLRGKAVEKGMMDQEAADRLTDNEAYNLIFHAGFSTKEQISDVSGRGVGMDVVKTKIAQLNGSIDVESELGMGTKIAIKVPLTLAIMPTLMVMLDKQAFALPLMSVNEIFHLDLSRTNVVDGQEVVVVREKPVPLFYLKRWLIERNTNDFGEAHVVVVTVGTQKMGFVVDQLIGQEEVVIKPLGKMLNGTPGMAGATITGDGRIALILDVPSMLKAYASKGV